MRDDPAGGGGGRRQRQAEMTDIFFKGKEIELGFACPALVFSTLAGTRCAVLFREKIALSGSWPE